MTYRSYRSAIALSTIALSTITLAAVLFEPPPAKAQVSGNQVRVASSTHNGNAYTVTSSDCGTLLSFSNTTASVVSLPQAGASGLRAGCWMDLQSIGTGSLTITPITSTIDGKTSVQLTAGQGLHLVSNGTNYLTLRGGGGGSGSSWSNVTVSSTPTPVFSASGASGITFRFTLTGDVVASSLTGAAPGLYVFALTQDTNGGHAFAWPSNVSNAPVVDGGAGNTTYLQCQYDGTTCVGIGSDVSGAGITPGLTIPGKTSGSNTIAPPAIAGTGSTTNLAPNGTTVIPNACTGLMVQSIAADGTITCASPGSLSIGTAGVTIPGVTSGSNTLKPPSVAGTGSTTNLAPNGTTVIPNGCSGMVVQSIAADGTITCGAGGGSSIGAAGVTIPGATSGSNTIKPATSAGTGSTTFLAANGTTVVPNACPGQVVQSIAADGTITCGAGGGGGGGSLTLNVSLDLGPLAYANGYTAGVIEQLWGLAQDTEGGIYVPFGNDPGYVIAYANWTTSNNSAISRTFYIPSDWDNTQPITVTFEAGPGSASATGNFGWKAKVACQAAALNSWTWNAGAVTAPYAVSATLLGIQESTTAALPVTNCTPGKFARIAVLRDNTVSGNSSAAGALMGVRLNYTRK